MMIQTAQSENRHFAMRMDEHTALAGRFARAFGNDGFEPVEPRDFMLYVIDNHDKGWAVYDSAPMNDRNTGLPYDFTSTPLEVLMKTSTGSPEFNMRRHAYCGLLSSMHTWGLYNGRYGMSDELMIDGIAATDRPKVDRMLEFELDRQTRLRSELAANPESATWISGGRLMQNYKQLQFFDTLAPYFNRTHTGARKCEVFHHVPKNEFEDVSLCITPVGGDTYSMEPFPFASSPIQFEFSGRYLRATDADTDWSAELGQRPPAWQTVIVTAQGSGTRSP